MLHLNNTLHKRKINLPLFSGKGYISVIKKFWMCHFLAALWMAFSILLSLPWLHELGQIITEPAAFLIIAGIGYIPGYINFFIISSLLMDKQPRYRITNPKEAITIVIACRNEEDRIVDALSYISKQDYSGVINVIVVDNASTDNTSIAAKKAGLDIGIPLTVLYEEKPGKHHALNKALEYVTTEYLITLDADTLLHKSAIRYLVSRICSAPDDVCAVAGVVLVKNSRTNFVTRLQEWDYFLGIASIKRMQGLYQGTLVAQGAYSIYQTKILKLVGGWPDAIGEDIVLTWRFLQHNLKVYFEPLAVAFTEVPSSLKHLTRQRSRWARGMIEALKIVKPWQHPSIYVKYLTGINLIMPYLDLIYTFCWVPGLILALFHKFWIVGPVTLFVIPLALIQNLILYNYQQTVFKKLKLNVRKNLLGYIIYVLCYQMLASPMSILGYTQEAFSLHRIWK